MKKWTKSILAAGVSLAMLIPPIPMPVLAQTTTTENNVQTLPEGFETTLVNAWKDMNSNINVSAYKLSYEELETYYNQVLNAHPELFYVRNHSVSWISGSSYVTSIKQNYDADITKDEIATEISKFNGVVDQAVSLVTSDMEDYEKALVIHDWLATHCAYDYESYLAGTVQADSYTAYGALVNKKAVCEGYSKTYRYLMEDKLGIPCEIVSSSSMSHAWNMIQIDGKYYHVDVTWDDPVWDSIGRVRHTYFLLSDKAMQEGDGIEKRPHSGWNGTWTASDSGYEGALWANSLGSVIPYNGNWYYTQYTGADSYLMKTNHLLTGTPKSVYKIDKWKTKTNGNWTSCFSYPAVYQRELIFNGPKAIYRMPFDTEAVTVLYTPPAEEVDVLEEGIYGLKLDDTMLSYAIQTTPNREGSQSSYIKTVKNPAVKEISGTLNITGTPRYGQTVTAAVVLGEGIDGNLQYQWYRDNIAIADTNKKDYTIVKEDIGKKISVKVKINGCFGELSAQIDEAVLKAIPVVSQEKPNVIVEKGNKLSTATLPGGYKFLDGEQLMNEAGTYSCQASYCPDDSIYEVVSPVMVTVNVVEGKEPESDGSENNNPGSENENPEGDEPKMEDSEEESNEQNETVGISLVIKGTENYGAANEVFQLVNATRKEKGLAELNLDKALTDTAMQRAAEIAINFDHTRPDGTSCFSAFPNANVSMAENIAVGQRTAEDAMDSWLNSAGHYANIMNSGMKNIGIGCFVDDRGICYWVQCFDSASKHTETTISNRTVTRTIPVQADVVSLLAEAAKTYGCKDETTEIGMVIRNMNAGFSYSRPVIESASFKFTSDNEEVAKVDATGKITLQGTGKATITATLKGAESMQVSQTIEKQDHQKVTTDTKAYCATCGTVLWEKTDTEQDNEPPKDETPDNGTPDEIPKDETPDSGNADETSKDETPDTGNSDDPPKDETPDNGNPDETPKDETPDTGKPDETPKDEIPDNGSTDEVPKNETSNNGNSDETPKDEPPGKENPENQPPQEIPDKEHSGGESQYEGSTAANPSKETPVGGIQAESPIKDATSGTVTYTQPMPQTPSGQSDITAPNKVTLSKVKKKKKRLIVSWKKDLSVTGYEIRYSQKKNFSSAKKIVIKTNTATRKNIKKIKPNKRYYVSIRSYKDAVVNGVAQRLYSPWSTKNTK